MDEDYFWMKIEAVYGNVSLHIKSILLLSNLVSMSLARLTREGILRIEQDMRQMAPDAAKKAANGGSSLETVYGRYADRPHEFRFMEGEILCLLDLAEIVRSNGIKPFLKPQKKSRMDIGSAEEQGHYSGTLLGTPENQKAKLRIKIENHFSNPKYHLDHQYFMENMIITMHRSQGKYRADIECPLCTVDEKKAKLSATVDVTGNWNIYSFTRHVTKRHSSGSNSAAPKRHASDVVCPEASPETSSPSKVPSLMEADGIENENKIHIESDVQLESSVPAEADEGVMEFSIEFLDESLQHVEFLEETTEYLHEAQGISEDTQSISEDSSEFTREVTQCIDSSEDNFSQNGAKVSIDLLENYSSDLPRGSKDSVPEEKHRLIQVNIEKYCMEVHKEYPYANFDEDPEEDPLA